MFKETVGYTQSYAKYVLMKYTSIGCFKCQQHIYFDLVIDIANLLPDYQATFFVTA